MQVRIIENPKLINIIVSLSFMFGALFLGRAMIGGLSERVLLLVVGVPLLFLSFIFWRQAVLAVSFLLIFEGALRKWVFPGSQQAIYILKDVILSVVYIRYFGGKIIQHERIFSSFPLNPLFVVFFFWGMISLFNPNLPSFSVGLFGLKTYFFYIPLFYLLPEIFNRKEPLTRYLFFYVLCSIPISILGIIQYSSPLESSLVGYVGWSDSDVQAISTVGGNPRITGSFSYISGYVTYLSVLVLIILALLNMQETLSRSKKLVLILALVLTMGNIFMTGSRGPIFILIILIPLFLIMIRRLPYKRMFRILPRVVLVVVVVGFSLSFFFKEALSAFWERASTSTDTRARIISTVATPFSFAEHSSAMGYGIGITHQAAQFLLSNQPLNSTVPQLGFEGEPERIMLEIGIIGFLLFYMLKLMLLVSIWKISRKLMDPDLKIIAVVVFLLQLSFFLAPVVFNVTASFYYWFFSGFILLLPKLDQKVIGIRPQAVS